MPSSRIAERVELIPTAGTFLRLGHDKQSGLFALETDGSIAVPSSMDGRDDAALWLTADEVDELIVDLIGLRAEVAADEAVA